MMKCDWGDHHSPNIRSFAMASDRLIDFVYMYIKYELNYYTTPLIRLHSFAPKMISLFFFANMYFFIMASTSIILL